MTDGTGLVRCPEIGFVIECRETSFALTMMAEVRVIHRIIIIVVLIEWIISSHLMPSVEPASVWLELGQAQEFGNGFRHGHFRDTEPLPDSGLG